MNQPECSPDPPVEAQVELSLQSCPEPEQAIERAGDEFDNDPELRDESRADGADVPQELDALRAELALMFEMPETTFEKPVDSASLDDRFHSFISGGDVQTCSTSPKTADDGETDTEHTELTATGNEDATTAYMDELLARNRNRSNAVTTANEDSAPEPVPDGDNAADRSWTRGKPRHRMDRRLLESATLDSNLAVKIRRSESGETLSDARLTDVSLSGAQFSLTSPVTAGEHINIEFRCDESEFRIQTEAEVRWAHLGRNCRWATGVKFDQPLTRDTLHDLATRGLIDRRSSPRFDVKIHGTVKREGRPDLIPVRLWDLSTHGLRLSSAENLEPDERILIQLQKPGSSDICCPAHVRWVASQKDGIMAGCEFVNTELAANIASLINRVSARRKSGIRVTTVAITLIAVVALWVHHESIFERLDAAWQSRAEFSQTAVRLWNSL